MPRTECGKLFGTRQAEAHTVQPEQLQVLTSWRHYIGCLGYVLGAIIMENSRVAGRVQLGITIIALLLHAPVV